MNDPEFPALAPRPIPSERRKRILRRVLRPLLQRQAEEWRRRAAQTEAPGFEFREDLLILLLYQPGLTGRIGDSVRGMIRLMKLVFLAQKQAVQAILPTEEHARLAYEFVPFRCGPSSAEVYNDLQALIWAGLVKRTEYDQDRMPVTRNDDFGRLEETDFSSANAAYELSKSGLAYAARLTQTLHQPGIPQSSRRNSESEVAARPESVQMSRYRFLLNRLAILKLRVISMSVSQLLTFVYRRWPEYSAESELLTRQDD